MKLGALNEHVLTARDRVDALEAELAAAYLSALRSAGRKAASRFRTAATPGAITAATNPKWVQPDPGELIDQEALAAAAQKKAAPIQERALKLAVPVGISFDVSNPLAQQFLGGLADRSARILDGFSGEVAAAIGAAYEQGLSVSAAAQLLRAKVESASEVQAALLARSDLVSIANGGSLLAAQLVAQASEAAGEGGGGTFKTWITAGDERVRDTHAEADGQTVPLDQPFDVGGESLMYPGDPDGSLEETANCRCSQVYGDSMTAAAIRAPTVALSSRVTMDETPEVTSVSVDAPRLWDVQLTAAAADGQIGFTATLIVEDQPTSDGRIFAPDSVTWRPTPLPLMLMTTGPHGEQIANLCGRIDQIWRSGDAMGTIQCSGVFDTSAAGVEAPRLVVERMLTGISMDLASCDTELLLIGPDTAEEQAEDAYAEEVGGEIVGEGPMDDYEAMLLYTAAEIGGATICPLQAMSQATISVAAAAEVAEKRLVWDAGFVLFATAPGDATVASTASAGETLDRTIADAVRLTAVACTDANREQLAALTAAATTERESLRQEIAAMTEALPKLASAVKELGPALLAVKREIVDRLSLVESQQTAGLTASGATVEGLEDLGRRLEALDTIANDLERLRDLVERKPRNVEFKRDDRGRLAGLVEG